MGRNSNGNQWTPPLRDIPADVLARNNTATRVSDVDTSFVFTLSEVDDKYPWQAPSSDPDTDAAVFAPPAPARIEFEGFDLSDIPDDYIGLASCPILNVNGAKFDKWGNFSLNIVVPRDRVRSILPVWEAQGYMMHVVFFGADVSNLY